MSQPFFLPPPTGADRVRPTPAPAWAGGVRHLPLTVTFGAPAPEPGNEQEAAPSPPPLAAEVRPGFVLGRGAASVVEVVSLDAYPEGIELWVRGASSLDALAVRRRAEGIGPDVFGRHWPLVGEDSSQLPETLLRIGVRYEDGRRATNVGGWDSPAGGPSLWPLSGGSSGGRHRQGYWIAPPPEAGGLTLLCAWPAAGIALSAAEIGAEELRAAVGRSAALFPRDGRVQRDGRSWRLGTAETVKWIRSSLQADPGVSAAIPPVFAAYGALAPVDGEADERRRHQQRLCQLLAQAGGPEPWWLGFLDTGAADVVFPYAPRVEVSPGHGYVVVEAGAAQAIDWREKGNDGPLADLIFAGNRSWLLHSTWDHEETFVGGPETLLDALAADPLVGPRVSRTQPEAPGEGRAAGA